MDTEQDEQIEAIQVEEDELRSAVLAKLIENGVAEVRIEFDGSGDEGQIEDITCTKADGTPGALDWPCDIPGKVTHAAASESFIPSNKTPSEESRPMTMHELLDEWAYELLVEVGLDWVNNDGGYGEIVITPADDAIRCEMNIRF